LLAVQLEEQRASEFESFVQNIKKEIGVPAPAPAPEEEPTKKKNKRKNRKSVGN